MNVSRGDVVLFRMTFASGSGSKVRPGVVIQSDHNNTRLKNTIVAMVTSTTKRTANEPSQLLVDVTTPEGKQSGLHLSSAVTCENLATVEQSRIIKTVGHLPTSLMSQLDTCIRASLDVT